MKSRNTRKNRLSRVKMWLLVVESEPLEIENFAFVGLPSPIRDP